MDTLLTIKQVVKILNCKPSTAYAWVKEGKLPAYRINGLLRFKLSEIEGWVDQNRILPGETRKQGGKISKLSKSINIDTLVRNTIDAVRNEGVSSSSEGGARPNQARKGGR